MNSQHLQSLFLSIVRKAKLAKVLLYLTSTISLLLGQGAQLVGFIVLARYLGAEQFGLLMAITATTAVGLSMSGFGTEEVMLRRGIREPFNYPKLLGHSLILTLIGGSFFSVLVVIGLNTLLPMAVSPGKNIEVLSIFAFSNILLARWIVLAEFIFIAQKQIMYANIIVTGFAIARAVAAVVGCVVIGVNQLEIWAFWNGGIYVLGVVVCMAAVWRFGAPEWCVLREEISRGIHVDTAQLIINLRQNIDRLVLTAVASPITVGTYSVASNIVRVSLVTINSFSRLSYPDLAVAGIKGASATGELAIKYLPVVVGLGALNSIALFAAAPLLPWLFGKEFGESVHYMMVLCWLPILVGIQNVAFDALGAAERHGIRAIFYNTLGVIAIGLVAGLTYLYGVNGAFIGIFFSQAVLCAALWLCLIILGQRGRRLPL